MGSIKAWFKKRLHDANVVEKAMRESMKPIKTNCICPHCGYDRIWIHVTITILWNTSDLFVCDHCGFRRVIRR